MKNQLHRIACVLALCGLAGAGGCAGKGAVPSAQIANTEKAIADARNNNASTHAPLELKMAEDKLKAAKAAVEKKEYDQARRLVEEAQADVDLARAETRSAKARQTAKEMRDSMNTLRQEIERAEKGEK